MKKVEPAARETCELRMGQAGVAQVRIRNTDPQTIHDELASRVKMAPHLFERIAVCIDLSSLEIDHHPQPDEINAVFDAVRRAGMLPVGLGRATDEVEALARALNVPVLTQYRNQRGTPTATPAVETAPAPAPVQATPAPAAVADVSDFASTALMRVQPVRSGQRVYARNRDLVVTSTVGAGAEVIADGCVHIYGSLRGKALAGARGEVSARVFCQEFNAELVSIAGVFRVFETIPSELAGKPVQAWLEGEDLKLARIGA
jgi:septum site-determining protein MinC